MNDHVYIDDIVVDTIGIENVPSLQDLILSVLSPLPFLHK